MIVFLFINKNININIKSNFEVMQKYTVYCYYYEEKKYKC